VQDPVTVPRPERGTLAAFYEPEWAGGWALTRWLWVIVAALCTGRMAFGMGDVWGAPDMVFTRSIWRLSNVLVLDVRTAWLLWAIAMAGIALVAFRRGAAFRLGLLMWVFGAQTLLAWEALNVKRYDVLFLWITFALFLSPAGEDDLTRKWRSPLARRVMLVVYCALYGSTGLLKALHEPGWWTGETLDHDLLSIEFGQKAVGMWVAGKTWLTAPMGWWTVLFEAGFPFFVWFRRPNVALVVLGIGFHLGLLVLMDVGPFSLVAVSAYPVLLDPEMARRGWERFQAWLTRPR
jgi:hypothetical protein